MCRIKFMAHIFVTDMRTENNSMDIKFFGYIFKKRTDMIQEECMLILKLVVLFYPPSRVYDVAQWLCEDAKVNVAGFKSDWMERGRRMLVIPWVEIMKRIL